MTVNVNQTNHPPIPGYSIDLCETRHDTRGVVGNIIAIDSIRDFKNRCKFLQPLPSLRPHTWAFLPVLETTCHISLHSDEDGTLGH